MQQRTPLLVRRLAMGLMILSLASATAVAAVAEEVCRAEPAVAVADDNGDGVASIDEIRAFAPDNAELQRAADQLEAEGVSGIRYTGCDESGSGSEDLESGGIGLTPGQLETRNGVTDCEEFEEVNAGACSLDADDDDLFVYYLLSEDQDTGLQRLVVTALGAPLEASEQLARLFLPTDAVLTDTGSAPNGNTIQFWESDWLAEHLGNDEAIWGAYAPGTVYVQFVPDDADEPGSDDIAYVEISVPAAEYDIVETETNEAPNGRTRHIMYAVMDPAASYVARYTALEEIIRLGYEDQQDATVIIVFAVSDESEVGGGANAGRAAVSRDGEGLDPGSDDLIITDDGGQIQIAVPNEFGSETVYFAAKE